MLEITDLFCRRSPEKSATHTDFLETVDQSLESREACVSVFLEAYLYPLMRIITAGVGEWTTDSRYVSARTVTVQIQSHVIQHDTILHHIVTNQIRL